MRSESEQGVLISSSYTHTQRHVHTAECESVGINCVCSHKYPEVVIFKWHPGAQGAESFVTCGADLEGPQREHTLTHTHKQTMVHVTTACGPTGDFLIWQSIQNNVK